MSAETICEAKLQIEIMNLKDDITYLKSHHEIAIDENQEITEELANLRKKLEDSKKEALDDQKIAHFEEIQLLRVNLHHEAMEFIVAELTAAGVPESNFIGKLEKMEDDLGELLEINQRMPIKTSGRQFQKDIEEKNRKYHEERKAERLNERKRRHGEMLWADQCIRDEHREKRLKLEKLIEDMEEEERNKEYYFEKEPSNIIEVETSE